MVEELLADVVADGFALYFCGPTVVPNALAACYQWHQYVDLLTVRGFDTRRRRGRGGWLVGTVALSHRSDRAQKILRRQVLASGRPSRYVGSATAGMSRFGSKLSRDIGPGDGSRQQILRQPIFAIG